MKKNKEIKDAIVYDEHINEKEEVREEKVKENNKEEKQKKNKKEKKVKKDKKEGFMTTLNRELKKVVWPSASLVIKYTFAVLLFCVVLCLFFKGIELLAALLKELFI